MKIQLVTKPLAEIKSEYIVLPLFEGGKSPFNGVVTDFLSDNPKFGKTLEAQLLYSKSRKLYLLGCGKPEKFDYQTLQNWAGTGVKSLLRKDRQITLIAPQSENLTPQQIGEAIAIGIEIASHDPTLDYKSEKEEHKLVSVEVVVEKAERGYQEGLKRGVILAEGINLARKLSDMPANEMTPSYFLTMSRKIAKEDKLKLTVIDEKVARKMGMGAFVGVAQGSDEPSYMITLEYQGDARSKEKVGIAGKGITFDTGGTSLKPGPAMVEMKYDMCGAASTLAILMIASRLNLKVNLVAAMPVTENMISGKSQRPSDIIKSYCGKTVEILNTDAEGRLILLDALTYLQKDLKATKLIDLATLTGAQIIALGNLYTGVYSNNPEFAKELIEKAGGMGEKMWGMPMDEEFAEMIKSDIADITNVGHGGSMPGAAGSITGAKFIEAGVKEKTPWVHLDIGGTAWDMKSKPYRGIGATGVGIKTLIDLIS